MEKYYLIACHVLWREFCYYAALSRNVFDIRVLKQGLHNTPEILRQELQDAIDAVEEGCSAILIGYGLCSNGVEGITARHTKLVVARGHDCITYLLGSRERYQEYFDAHPGTYWYSPGWIDMGEMPGKARYERLVQSYIDKYGEENADYLMEAEQGWIKEYSNAAYTDVGFGDTIRCKEYTRECAAWLGWNYDEVAGDPRLIKDLLEGNWNAEDFLVVSPGKTIAASHDDAIIKIKENESPAR